MRRKILALLRVTRAPSHSALWGALFTKFYFEATVRIWLMAQAVFKFYQNFTSCSDIVEKSGTLLKRYYLV